MSDTERSGESPHQSTRLVRALVAGRDAGDYAYDGVTADGRSYAVTVNGRQRIYPLPAMVAWHRGFIAGQQHQPRSLVDVPAGDGLAPLIDLLTAPGLADQCRIAIRTAMDTAGLTVSQLADAAGVTRNTVSDALRFGAADTLSLATAEKMMAGLGGAWHVSYVDPAGPAGPPAPDLAAPTRAEPVALRRLRALALTDARGLVRWVDDMDPTRAVRAFRLHVRLPGDTQPVQIKATELPALLIGVADAADPATAVDVERITAAAR
jgi:hypothetical protein